MDDNFSKYYGCISSMSECINSWNKKSWDNIHQFKSGDLKFSVSTDFYISDKTGNWELTSELDVIYDTGRDTLVRLRFHSIEADTLNYDHSRIHFVKTSYGLDKLSAINMEDSTKIGYKYLLPKLTAFDWDSELDLESHHFQCSTIDNVPDIDGCYSVIDVGNDFIKLIPPDHGASIALSSEVLEKYKHVIPDFRKIIELQLGFMDL